MKKSCSRKTVLIVLQRNSQKNIIHLKNNASKLNADLHKDFIKSFLFVIIVDLGCDIKKFKSAADPQTKIHHLE